MITVPGLEVKTLPIKVRCDSRSVRAEINHQSEAGARAESEVLPSNGDINCNPRKKILIDLFSLHTSLFWYVLRWLENAGRYRNRTKRFGLRLNLIAGLLNYELAHAS